MKVLSNAEEDATPRIRCLVLDFDGVILESVGIKTAAFRELFREHEDLVDEIVAYHLDNNGVSRFVKFEHIYRHFLRKPFDSAEKVRIENLFSDIVYRRVVACPFVPGARELLEAYASKLPIYVASASPHDELWRVITERRLQEFFIEVYGHPHAKDTVIRSALEQQGVSRAEVLFVGDSVKDFEAASKEGVRFVGRRNQENLEELGVPLFDDLVGVSAWLADRVAGAGSRAC